VNLYTFHVQFPYRPMRSTKNRPAIHRSIAIDASDMPAVYDAGIRILLVLSIRLRVLLKV
jgi:hypothetical protein